MWENIDKSRKNDSAHYSIMHQVKGNDGIDALRYMFPDAQVDRLNFVLFSTSGVHGTYNTIEEVENTLKGNAKDSDRCEEVTFLIVHPRLVALRYGTCTPKNVNDIEYLKKLRENSRVVMTGIGY